MWALIFSVCIRAARRRVRDEFEAARSRAPVANGHVVDEAVTPVRQAEHDLHTLRQSPALLTWLRGLLRRISVSGTDLAVFAAAVSVTGIVSGARRRVPTEPEGGAALAWAANGGVVDDAVGPLRQPELGLPTLWQAPALPRWLRRLLGWVSVNATDLGLVAALVSVAGIVHGVGMTRSPAPFDDEGTYVAQAWAVQHMHALAPYTYWYDHPPLGWLLISSVTWPLHLFGATSHAVDIGRIVVLGAQLVSTALLYVMARRIGFIQPFASLAVLLFVLSPVAVHYQRMVLLDNLATPFLLAAFVCALTPRRRLWAYLASGACLALAALVKETSLLFLPVIVYVAWRNSDYRNRHFSLTVFGCALVLIGGFYPLYALLNGELLAGPHHTSLEYGILFQLVNRTSSGSIFDPHSGTRSLIDTWLGFDHALPLAAVVMLPAALAIPRLRPAALALALPVAMIFRPHGYVPAMLIITMLPFGALVAAGVLDAVWQTTTRSGRLRKRGRPLAWIGPAVATAATLGFLHYAAPDWVREDHAQMTENPAAPYWQAEAWLTRHVPHTATMITDDTVWTDLVERGFRPSRIVWFYKLDLDPAVRHRYPSGYRDFQYIILSGMVEGVATTTNLVPQTAAAIRHSHVVAAFASDGERIEVRRITPPADNHRLTPPFPQRHGRAWRDDASASTPPAAPATGDRQPAR